MRTTTALISVVALILAAAASSVESASAAFAAPPLAPTGRMSSISSSGSSLLGGAPAQADRQGASASDRATAGGLTSLHMGKQAAFGPFTPVVIGARSVVGEKRFNQIRGKGITLHSQVITEFCVYAGVPRELRQGLIRLAKKNGNTLGFLS
mmetsp:Transcript_42925/g.83950  ORF Transcript_42925/g.83950 Transcript_42925/m.83950 type:complete len:152 (-) Transcript_42925:363-818(-)|eukprot:CAMPEP_0173389524 /NCGR_PEP_ID=MMETSP1356-20130122/12523_1 /TAXON_ID=77927 ORGANISM="Hemiselmis virescens, Strain PCC157" /NCGR_SAMPLE_ID=MMETSP1356 /ASSEMBLY_ACC=CAM_ASM_000847 /LENGTH=151 /DNA_ID=CAMNT_0014346721 /DNA_START=132 /DNA_END=587 /DNA_ORIENTATION=+